MANRWFTQFFGTAHKKPVLIDCNFVVNAPNVNGAGITSLKGAGVNAVFMNTTASIVGDTHTSTLIDGIASTTGLVVGTKISGSGIPAGAIITAIASGTSINISPAATATAAAVTLNLVAAESPNPAAGYIYVRFEDNYNFYYIGQREFIAPLSGTNILISGVLTVGQAYVITAVGTSTLANWQAVGLPRGLIPTVGQSFLAITAGGSGGTGTVQAVTSSGIFATEVVGNAASTLGQNYNGASILGGASGAYMIFKTLNAAGAVTAPAANCGINMSFYLSNSNILVKGD